MSNIIVNTLNQRYSQVTNNKGVIGIGTPYTESSSGYEIIVDSNRLSTKLNGLRNLQNEFRQKSIQELRDFKKQGESFEASVMIRFKEKLREVLFLTNIPSEVSGNKVRQFFPYSVQNFSSVDAVRDYIVAILQDWIDLFDKINALTPGLSRVDIVSTETTPVSPVSVQPPNLIIVPDSETSISVGAVEVELQTYTIPITDAILSSAKTLINLKTAQFFDEDREYKTVLNFGDDNQYLVEAWRTVKSDSSSIQLKLFKSLDVNIEQFYRAYIARDLANPVVDILSVQLPPEEDTTPFLRPANLDVGKFAINKQEINNVTLTTLGMVSGTVGSITGSVISYEDRVFNRWYTADFNSSELNVDFTNYTNFVNFGSAQKRLDAFRQKLINISTLNSSASVSSSNLASSKNALEIENIKRNFDIYEQFLYFNTTPVAYSASAYYLGDEPEYHISASWPKQVDGTIYSPFSTTGNNWYFTQSLIAQRFDDNNPNYLIKHIPSYLQEDIQSEEFIRFVGMFGHMMDNIKLYIDQLPYIYSTTPDPFEDLTMDQVYEVAKSFGLDLPNAYSLENLQSFISSNYDGAGARSLVAETWKRFIHSAIYLRKIKGTRNSFDTLLNTYGINSPIVQIKESSYPSVNNFIKSEELVYGLRFTSPSNSIIKIPFVSASISTKTLQIRFNPELRQSSSLVTGDLKWAIDLVPHPSASGKINSFVSGTFYTYDNTELVNYGKINIVSGSDRVVIASSSYFPLFGDDYTNVMLRSESQDMTVIQTDGEQILFEQSSSLNLGSIWNSTEFIYVGGSGSIKQNQFDGIIDEIYLWGENITNENFIKQAYDPGTYYGNTYTSSYESLYTKLSFSQPLTSITQSATNESPYVSMSMVSNLPTNGFTTASYERISRNIKQYVPVVGSTVYSNNKIQVVPAPTFNNQFVDNNGTYILSRTNSIKSIKDKRYTSGQTYASFALSPIDFINQNIIRSMGMINVNYLIGSPRQNINGRYTELDTLLNFYLEKYNQNVDPNQYIRFFKNLIKAPSEYAENITPARTRLLNGLVIESPLLDRSKIKIQKAIKVDGKNTIIFDNYISGSGSANVGAYTFDANYKLETEINTTEITKPVLQQINNQIVTSSMLGNNGGYATINSLVDTTEDVGVVSSTTTNKLPTFRQFTQRIGNSVVTSSLQDINGSSVPFIDSLFDCEPKTQTTNTGYQRNPYLGIKNRIASEKNTIGPLYAIESSTNFNDIGTTTYFYNGTGIYKFNSVLSTPNLRMRSGSGVIEPLINPYKKSYYRAKFNVSGEVESSNSEIFSNITLLNFSSLIDYPGRQTTTIAAKTYLANTSYTGILKISNLFSLYKLSGLTGLRFRLYSNPTTQLTDISRSFTSPAGSDVLFDGLLTGESIVFPYTIIQTTNSTLYFTVTNETGTDINSEITMNYFEYEPFTLIPKEYLPRHYKFNRLNGIAQRRRSYLGCKTVYCPEGCPPDVTDTTEDSPVEIFLTPRTAPIVSNTRGGGSTVGGTPATGRPTAAENVLLTGTRGKLGDARK